MVKTTTTDWKTLDSFAPTAILKPILTAVRNLKSLRIACVAECRCSKHPKSAANVKVFPDSIIKQRLYGLHMKN
jgi:hypothetical protein